MTPEERIALTGNRAWYWATIREKLKGRCAEDTLAYSDTLNQVADHLLVEYDHPELTTHPVWQMGKANTFEEFQEQLRELDKEIEKNVNLLVEHAESVEDATQCYEFDRAVDAVRLRHVTGSIYNAETIVLKMLAEKFGPEGQNHG